MATDKQVAEMAAAVAHSARTSPLTRLRQAKKLRSDAGAEEISMEDVLGGGTQEGCRRRRQEAADEVPQVESQTF